MDVGEPLRYPRSREYWTRDRTTLHPQRERDWPEQNFKLSDYATADEIATAIAGVEQTWRDMGRRVKELNRAAPRVRTIAAMRSMAKDEEKAVREVFLAASDRRVVREIANSLREDSIFGLPNHSHFIEGKTSRLIAEFEERQRAAFHAACAEFEANWKPAPVDDATWEKELHRRGWVMARKIVEEQLSPKERERRMSGYHGQSEIYDLVIKRSDQLMATSEGERFIEAARELSNCRCDACRHCDAAEKCLNYDRVCGVQPTALPMKARAGVCFKQTNG